MADQRKSFRPRRLAHDGRSYSRGRVGAALILLALLTSTPAVAQELGLKHGQASLSSGKYENAVRQFSATVNDKDSTPEQVAKALYLRGVALRRMGQPARAISDLGAAVWLGLPSSDKARALVNKGLAYRSVGLSSQAQGALAQARRSSGGVDQMIAEESRTAVAVASGPVSSGTSASGSVWDRFIPSFGSSSSTSSSASAPAAETPPQQAPQSDQTSTRTAAAAPSTGWGAEVNDEPEGNAVSRWFGSFGGESAPAPSAAPSPAPPTTTASRTTTAPPSSAAPRTTAAPPSAESWAANTTTQKEGESGTAVGRWFSRQTASTPAAAPSTASQAPRGGGYTVQLANSRSKSEAQALWSKAKSSNPKLGSATPRVEKVDIGSFGTFYSVKIGPFATSAESTKVCNSLKRGGTDCSVVAPGGP